MERKNVAMGLLILVMIGVIIFSIFARDSFSNNIKTSKQYVDNYVSKVDDSFVYKTQEKYDDGSIRFYYESDKHKNFTLVVTITENDGEYVLSDNYNTLNIQSETSEYFNNLFGSEIIVDIVNKETLNILPTVEEMISYNNFSLNVGIKGENIPETVNSLKQILIDKKIDCSVYFYHFTEEQYEKYKQKGLYENVNEFENYNMVIIRNGQVETEFQYTSCNEVDESST